jgi:hypothetical protein
LSKLENGVLKRIFVPERERERDREREREEVAAGWRRLHSELRNSHVLSK